jgi:hypothetical protein
VKIIKTKLKLAQQKRKAAVFVAAVAIFLKDYSAVKKAVKSKTHWEITL